MKYEIDELKKECLIAPIENEFPNNMGLLEEFRRLKICNKSYLEGTSVLFIQHHLYPFIGRLKTMTEDGMNREKTWIIDIPYSSINKVVEKVKKKFTIKKNIRPSKKSLKPLENYTDYQLSRTKKVIRDIIKTNPKKLLVIDDGAYFIRALHELFNNEPQNVETLRDKLYIVEQTTRGLRYLEDDKYILLGKKLNTPIVSIAKSVTKEYLESPFIGVSCRRALEGNVKVTEKLKEKNLRIGVIGYGAVGEAVFNSIKGLLGEWNYVIDVIEIDKDKWEEIRNNGGNPMSELSGDDNKYSMLFGCTGERSFTWNDRVKICKDGLLISCSSAAVEFSRSEFIITAKKYDDDPITMNLVNEEGKDPKDKIHMDLFYQDLNQQFYFLNSCYPINFTGFETIPIKFILPTHALMYAATYQVINQPLNGLQPLSSEYDNWIYENAFNF